MILPTLSYRLAGVILGPLEPPSLALSDLERRLLNHYQRDFPLCARPYAAMARQEGVSEGEVLACLSRLQQSGALSRVGVVFKPNQVGVSSLAAMAVATEDLERVAAFVTALPEVNHNYERENHLNLWFVITAPDAERLQEVRQEIQQGCQLPVLLFPMEEGFHIDLGFRLMDTGCITTTP